MEAMGNPGSSHSVAAKLTAGNYRTASTNPLLLVGKG